MIKNLLNPIKNLTLLFFVGTLTNIAVAEQNRCSNLSRDFFEAYKKITLQELYDHYINLDITQEYKDLGIDNQIYQKIAYDPVNISNDNQNHFSISFVHLKKLNDSVDKSLSASSLNLFKNIFLKLLKNHQLFHDFGDIYVDYKSLRIVSKNPVSPEVEGEFLKLFKKANQHFEDILYSDPRIRQMLAKAEIPPAHLWHTLGIGNNADYTNLLSRISRIKFSKDLEKYFDKNQKNDDFLYLTSDPGEKIALALKSTLGELEAKVYNDFNAIKKENFFDSEGYISSEVFEILRKENQVSKVIQRIENRFNMIISEEQAVTLINYYKYLDIYSPEILILDQQDINYGALGGILSGDIVGMGAANAYYIGKSIRSKSQESLINILRYIRKGQDESSSIFYQKINYIKNQLKNLGIINSERSFFHSGDDTVAHVVLNLNERKQRVISLVKSIADSQFSQSFRVVDLPQSPVDNPKLHFTHQEAVHFVTDMESVLKDTVKRCEGLKLYKFCKQIMFSGQVVPYSTKTTFNLLISGIKNSEKLPIQKIQELFEDSIKAVNASMEPNKIILVGEVIDIRI